MLEIKKSYCIFLTETWLNKDIEDAEILIEGYTIFRSDRIDRTRGGAAIYIKNELCPKKAATFSNSIVEYVIVKCSKLDTGQKHL